MMRTIQYIRGFIKATGTTDLAGLPSPAVPLPLSTRGGVAVVFSIAAAAWFLIELVLLPWRVTMVALRRQSVASLGSPTTGPWAAVWLNRQLWLENSGRTSALSESEHAAKLPTQSKAGS